MVEMEELEVQVAEGELLPHNSVEACLVNGTRQTDWRTVHVSEGDEVELYPATGEASLAALIVIGFGVGIGTATTIAFILLLILKAAILAGIALGLKALSNSPKGGFSPLGGNTSRPEESFGIAGLQNTILPGTPEWVPYGTRRVWGHIISSSTSVSRDGESMSFGILYFMGATGGDGIDAINDVLLNRTPIADFPGASFETRLGTTGQSVIGGFEDVSQSYGVFQSLLLGVPFIYTSNSTQMTRFKFVLQWPAGLRRISDRGEDLAGRTCSGDVGDLYQGRKDV